MALRTRRVKRVFAYEKTNAEKYVLVPDRSTTVTFENLCSVAARSTTLSLESSPTCDKRPSLRNENLHPRGPSRADRGHRHIHALVQRKKPAGRGRGVEADELCLRQDGQHARFRNARGAECNRAKTGESGCSLRLLTAECQGRTYRTTTRVRPFFD